MELAAIDMGETLAWAAEIWGWIGLAVAVPFLGFGIDRIDPAARGSYVFRVLVIPGVVLLWPIVLVRWAQLERRRAAR